MIGDDMDKIRIGIPRGLFYQEFHTKWRYFFEHLGCEVIESEKTNQQVIKNGKQLANDEMCLSFQTYLGHVTSLKGKVDYIIVPRIDNYGTDLQTCTNFLAAYDIVKNLIDVPLLNYNIDYENHETEKKGFFKMGRQLSKSYSEIRKAYSLACKMDEMIRNKKISKNYNRMSSSGFKVLVVGHSYTIHDDYFMKPIADQIEKNSGVLIYSDEFDESVTRKASKKYSRELYWKYQKEAIGSIALLENQIDGVVFISTFPCGPDSLVNELVMRKIHLPHLNLVIDDMDATAGIETRIESFMDMLYER